MKISKSNFPILDKLNKGILGNMPIYEKDKNLFFSHIGTLFVNNWKFYHKSFKTEINIISKPFSEASNKATNKLLQLFHDITVNDAADFDVKGTYIIGDFVCMIDFQLRKGKEDIELAFFVFDRIGIPIAFYIDSAKYKIYQNGWISSLIPIENNFTSIQNWINYEMGKIVIYKMFKSYAEVETKIIPPNSKVKSGYSKYVNDTDLKLTYLDSKWFTNLIKSDSFNVRGHFRLQPKKVNGEWTKELIWISEFQKNGYTAPARKNVEHNNA